MILIVICIYAIDWDRLQSIYLSLQFVLFFTYFLCNSHELIDQETLDFSFVLSIRILLYQQTLKN